MSRIRTRPRRCARPRVVILAAALCVAAPAFAQEAPDAIVKRVASDVIATIKSDPAIQAGNEARIQEVLEAKLLPNFDFTRMTALAMGRNWPAATPEQQKRVTDEFRALLVRTYSGALNNYRNETIDYKPLRMNPGDTDVTVRTLVVSARPGRRSRSTTAWRRRRTAGSATTSSSAASRSSPTIATSSTSQIKAGGVDGLIKTLADRNKGVAAK